MERQKPEIKSGSNTSQSKWKAEAINIRRLEGRKQNKLYVFSVKANKDDGIPYYRIKSSAGRQEPFGRTPFLPDVILNICFHR